MASLISTRDPTDRANDWKRLQELEDRALRSGLRRLSSEEVLELGRLYRRAASDLAQARSLGLDPRESALLNSLVGRAYGLIYTPERGGAASVAEFFTREFPRCFRRNFHFILAAFLVSVAGAFLGLFVTLSNREAIDLLMGPGWSRELEELGQRHRVGHDWLPSEERPLHATFLPVNNIFVAFKAFAGGIFFGLLTLYILVENGIMLGAAAVAVSRHHTAFEFWGFVAPHGVVELPSIFIAGGAGLMLAYALVNPGEYSRRTALSMAGRDAVVLILGVVAMLVIAGLTEAFFSPALISPYLKFLVAAVNLTAETAYFVAAGRGESGVQVFRSSGVQGRAPSGPEHLNTRTPEHSVAAIRPLPPL